MTKTYRAALVGCSRMGAFMDNEELGMRSIVLPYSHAAGYEACPRTDLVAGANTQLIFGFIESHRRGGARVTLPLEGNQLKFVRPGLQARQPAYAPRQAA
jgi:hypothetical protein